MTADAKAAARKAAASARDRAASPDRQVALGAHLTIALAPFKGRALSGYLPIRSEADPTPAMTAMARHGPVGVPEVVGRGLPLRFRRWTPGAVLEEGVFGVMVPKDAAEVVPSVLIVPMLAFDARGYRLGYGGGFYDRTLAALREAGDVFALGLAFAAQEVDALPVEATDQPLDAIVTEAGLRRF
ncbi:5-formyltetrahydrofolate cyclo-ligase [Palleronia sp. KMU-117]|uniref:5-formyltetrahydrofolate cyclo-ligase n=1 Tax=Palleronia sp. KMU-117 TaxID=3434108 RepID=UPI003D7524F1